MCMLGHLAQDLGGRVAWTNEERECGMWGLCPAVLEGSCFKWTYSAHPKPLLWGSEPSSVNVEITFTGKSFYEN